jgi:xanthine dehydrogenase accessory factor
MLDVIDKLDQWRQGHEEVAITTVVETWGSAPRPVGSKMVATQSGRIAGSVSAGCVEGAVIEASAEVISSGKPRLLEFGVADETAWSVGLACGGKIKVFIEPGFAFDSIYGQLKENISKGIPFLTITYLDGPENNINKKLLVEPGGMQIGDLDLPARGEMLLDQALKYFENDKSGIIREPGGTSLFIDVQPIPPRLIIIGAVHLAIPLVSIANTIGFDTILVDPRDAFSSRERFPDVDQLIQKWPDEAMNEIVLDKSTYIVVLTHDPKLDDPALISALKSDARYIGALGSQRTNQKRLERLKEAGLSENQLSRLHAPIGLDLGGRSPNEIAISILAEIVQIRNQNL